MLPYYAYKEPRKIEKILIKGAMGANDFIIKNKINEIIDAILNGDLK